MNELESDRLILRQWQARDFESYAEYYADADLAKHVGGQCSRAKAWRRMASLIGHWSLRGYGQWAVEERETGDFVGCVGLWFPEGWPELELGYWLMREKQGQGYAIEAAIMSRDYAYDVVGTNTLVSYIHPDNGASKRVAEKLGARFEQIIELLDYGPHCVYRHPKKLT